MQNIIYKNDFIFNNLISQFKDKVYTPGLRKCVKIPPHPPPYVNLKIFNTGNMFIYDKKKSGFHS